MRAEMWILVTAILWGGYPLVARAANFESPRGAFILSLVGLLPISILSWLSSGDGWPSAAGMSKLLVAGLMMGGGLVSFYMLASGPMEASVSIPVVDIAMLLASAVLAMIVYAEPLTLRKLLGLLCMVVGIALVRPGG